MKTYSPRQTIERAIIGTVAACNCYAVAGSVISYRNFSKWEGVDYADIWKQFEIMHKNHVPIDLITICRILSKQQIQEVSNCASNISGFGHLQFHCLMLLEMDLTEKFTTLLADANATISISDIPSGYAEKLNSAIAQVLELLQTGDKLETIDNGIHFLTESYDMPPTVKEALLAFKNNIDSRILTIKQQLALNASLKSIERLSTECIGNKQMALRELAALTTIVANKSIIDDNTLLAIHTIRKSL